MWVGDCAFASILWPYSREPTKAFRDQIELMMLNDVLVLEGLYWSANEVHWSSVLRKSRSTQSLRFLKLDANTMNSKHHLRHLSRWKFCYPFSSFQERENWAVTKDLSAVCTSYEESVRLMKISSNSMLAPNLQTFKMEARRNGNNITGCYVLLDERCFCIWYGSRTPLLSWYLSYDSDPTLSVNDKLINGKFWRLYALFAFI